MYTYPQDNEYGYKYVVEYWVDGMGQTCHCLEVEEAIEEFLYEWQIFFDSEFSATLSRLGNFGDDCLMATANY